MRVFRSQAAVAQPSRVVGTSMSGAPPSRGGAGRRSVVGMHRTVGAGPANATGPLPTLLPVAERQTVGADSKLLGSATTSASGRRPKFRTPVTPASAEALTPREGGTPRWSRTPGMRRPRRDTRRCTRTWRLLPAEGAPPRRWRPGKPSTPTWWRGTRHCSLREARRRCSAGCSWRSPCRVWGTSPLARTVCANAADARVGEHRSSPRFAGSAGGVGEDGADGLDQFPGCPGEVTGNLPGDLALVTPEAVGGDEKQLLPQLGALPGDDIGPLWEPGARLGVVPHGVRGVRGPEQAAHLERRVVLPCADCNPPCVVGRTAAAGPCSVRVRDHQLAVVEQGRVGWCLRGGPLVRE